MDGTSLALNSTPQDSKMGFDSAARIPDNKNHSNHQNLSPKSQYVNKFSLEVSALKLQLEKKECYLQNIEKYFTSYTTQDDLPGQSQLQGRAHFFSPKDTMDANTIKSYLSPKNQSVVATIKINGKFHNIGKNGKASPNLKFYSIGVYKDNENKFKKENFHTEDWLINSLINEVIRSKQSLSEYINDKFKKQNNQINKHVISIKLSASPCNGCVKTLTNFKKLLDAALGKNQYILRIKILRPYKLRNTIKDSESDEAKTFVERINTLKTADIKVKWQSKSSVEKMAIEYLAKIDQNNGKNGPIKPSINDELLESILSIQQRNFINNDIINDKRWWELGANRKHYSVKKLNFNDKEKQYVSQNRNDAFSLKENNKKKIKPSALTNTSEHKPLKDSPKSDDKINEQPKTIAQQKNNTEVKKSGKKKQTIEQKVFLIIEKHHPSGIKTSQIAQEIDPPCSKKSINNAITRLNDKVKKIGDSTKEAEWIINK